MDNALGEGDVGCLCPEGPGAADTSLTHEELPETTSWI